MVFMMFFAVLLYFGGRPPSGPKAELVFWGVGDSRSVFETAISGYESAHPNIKIKYQQIDEGDYEKELLKPGESKEFAFTIKPAIHLSFPNSRDERILEDGYFTLMVGNLKARFKLQRK